eukprot:5279651-Pyramimonas_sp.AAC.1
MVGVVVGRGLVDRQEVGLQHAEQVAPHARVEPLERELLVLSAAATLRVHVDSAHLARPVWASI